MVATVDVDRRNGTTYHDRVLDYVRRFQRDQVMAAAAVTDVKGDRSKRPAEQDERKLRSLPQRTGSDPQRAGLTRNVRV